MNLKKIKITLITPNLFAGGAERVISFLAKELSPDLFDITLVVVGYQKDVSYDISGVNTVFFNKSRVMLGVPKIFYYLLKNKPDVVISVIGHLNTVLAYQSICFPKTKFIAREVNVLSVLKQFEKSQNFILNQLYANRFKFFDAIICQSKDMLADLQKNYNVDTSKLHVINNPISSSFKLKTNTARRDNNLQFINVGRLSKEKGQERLIKMVSQIQLPFHLTIIGKGEEKSNLLKLVVELGLENQITFIEFTSEVQKYLSNSDLYLQTSYVEGFPNAVLESCAVGTPVIAIDAPGGINEIIQPGINGYIAKDENEFINYIKNVFNQMPFQPNKVSKTVFSKFNKEIILETYTNLIINIHAS